MASHGKVETSHQQPPLFARLQHRIAAGWKRSRISQRSEYSVERLLAFRDYHRTTSATRVIVVCVLAPIPALLVALGIDCIPLRPPSEGWRANYAVWIRLCAAMFFEALGVVWQVREVIISGTVSNTGASIIALGTAVNCVLVTIAVAEAWKFPIPFGYVLMTNVYVLIFCTWMILGIGPRVLANSTVLRQQIKAQLFIIANQGIVVVCYPVFSAVFDRLSATQQGFFVFLMPMIKFFTKQNIANAAKTSHEYVGPIVVFSVDLFNVYYVAICMQSAKSLVTTLVIISTDTFFIVIALRAIYKRVNSLDANDTICEGNYLQALLGLVRKVFQETTFSRDSTQRIRLLAPFPLRISDESSACMKTLSKTARLPINSRISTKSSGRQPSKNQSMTTIAVLPKKTQVAPDIPHNTHDPKLRVTPSSVAKLNNILASKAREEIVHDALQSLFHSEYILLAEYIELMVPMLYSLYLVVLFHLPVAAYYPHTASMTVSDLQGAVMSILAYAVIELVSFTVLLVLLWRKFGFSPLYQLAFVLETQGPALQGYLFVWTITILHLKLAHYGTWENGFLPLELY
ncbi:hypothetical protein L914_11153 [Phytophthora nicotianae]|uniref:Uncharacterized protein n=2 Tax=Phytophthora nicotianae TaxID=4792 RepID=V9EVU4_PHYNI|nr:hypothetical protein F443_11629 [Phytophthora nicotianae P1569]ETM43355.1 hypothetical protein L914_11153 [Phytophthora nicotianae]